MNTSTLTHLNRRLERDLGRNPYGGAKLRWAFSETLMSPMRVPGYDYKTNAAGLTVAHPKYEMRKMNPAFVDQWVVCRWEPPIPEAEWRDAFGYQMEWPKHGDYYPTNVALPAGVEPTLTLTEQVIQAERERENKTLADHQASIQRSLDLSDHYQAGKRADIIDDALPAFGKVPGTRGGGVSLPFTRFDQ